MTAFVQRRHGVWKPMAAVIVAALALPVPAQEVVLTRDGRRLRGRIIEDNGKVVRVRLATEGAGRVIADINYADLHPRTIYRLRLERISSKDARGQLDLARFAVENGLYDAARRRFARALAANPSLKGEVDRGLERLRTTASESLLQRAREQAGARAVLAAEKTLAMLLEQFPEEPAAEKGRRLLARIAPSLEEHRRAVVAEELTRRDTRRREALATARKLHAKGVELCTRGLLATRSRGTALHHFRASLQSCSRAQRVLRKLADANPRDRKLQETIAAVDNVIEAQLVKTHLHLASLYLVRQSYNDALAWANRALALQPDNREALAARARIEIAASSAGWGGNWRRWAR